MKKRILVIDDEDGRFKGIRLPICIAADECTQKHMKAALEYLKADIKEKLEVEDDN